MPKPIDLYFHIDNQNTGFRWVQPCSDRAKEIFGDQMFEFTPSNWREIFAVIDTNDLLIEYAL